MMRKIHTIEIREEIYITRLYAVDYFRKNKKEAARELEEHIICYIKISTFLMRLKCTDSKNAYDMVLETWIVECLKISKVSDKLLNFITKAVKNWKIELEVGRQTSRG